MKACYYGSPLIEVKIKTDWITAFFMRKYAKQQSTTYAQYFMLPDVYLSPSKKQNIDLCLHTVLLAVLDYQFLFLIG